MLPQVIWKLIFEFDPTYKNILCQCIDEIPDTRIAKTHKEYYNSYHNACSDRVSFHIDTLSGSCPYISLAVQDLLFFGNCTTLQFIHANNQPRSIYNNNSVYHARLDGIDTRLRPWEWWITLEYNNTITLISCAYHQIHGILIEIEFKPCQNTITKQINEQTAIRLFKQVKNIFLNTNNQPALSCFVEHKQHNIFHSQCTIPNAEFRTYHFSSFPHY